MRSDRGVLARIVTGPHEAHRQDPHRPMRYDTGRPRAIIRLRISQPRTVSVSNSLSGRHWELDQVPAVGDQTDIVQLGTGHPCVRRRRSTACGPSTTRGCVPRGRRPGATQRCLNPGCSERIRNSRRTPGGPVALLGDTRSDCLGGGSPSQPANSRRGILSCTLGARSTSCRDHAPAVATMARRSIVTHRGRGIRAPTPRDAAYDDSNRGASHSGRQPASRT